MAGEADRKSFWRPGLWGYLLFALVLYFLIFYDVLVKGDGTLVRGVDATAQSFPWLNKISAGWRMFEPPLWDFHSYSGANFIGELQTGVFYPGNILLSFLAGEVSQYDLDVYVYLHYCLAFFFMALFLRLQRLGTVPVLLGSFAFASHLDWAQPHRFVGMILLPLILLCLQKSWKSKERFATDPWLISAGMALGLTILAGHAQPYIHIAMALGFFTLFLCVRSDIRVGLRNLIWLGVVSVLFSAPQWLPTLDHLTRSYRWAPRGTPGLEPIPYEVYGFVDVIEPAMLEHMARGWFPWVALLAFLMAFLSAGKTRRLVLFGLVLGLFSLLASLGDAGLVSRVIYQLPLLHTVREAYRYMFLIFFSSALLLALVADFLWNRLKGRLDQATSHHRRLSHNPGTLAWVKASVGIALLGPLAAWMGWQAAPFLAVQPNEDELSPVTHYRRDAVIDTLIERQREEGWFRVLNYKQCLPRNTGIQFSLLTIRGYGATIYAPYVEFFLSALADPQSERLDQLGVKYVVSPEPLADFDLLTSAENRFLYRRPNPQPVFRLADRPRDLVVRDVVWRQNSVLVELDRPVAGTLVFAQPYYPGWTVWADGEQRELLQAGLFTAVELTGSESKVEFRFWPPYLSPGLIAATIPFLLLGAGWVERRRARDDTGG